MLAEKLSVDEAIRSLLRGARFDRGMRINGLLADEERTRSWSGPGR